MGCKIPADMRMIEMLSNQLRVDQAILTGTSVSGSNFIVLLDLYHLLPFLMSVSLFIFNILLVSGKKKNSIIY